MKPVLTKEQKEWLDSKLDKVNPVYVGFHGSHLYGLAHEKSDIDIKVIYLPSKEELILGNAIKTYNHKNNDLDIEVEVKSLSSFLKSVSSVDTNCVDLLHTPDEMILYKDPIWDEMVKHRKVMYAKKMKGLIGYIKTHTHKYNNKIDRLDEMNWLLGLAEGVVVSNPDDTVKDLAECSEFTDKKLKYIKPVTLVKDHEQQYLEVCGKKYIYTWSIKELIKALEHEVNRYGKRTNEGSDKGMDTKSLSHALRVLSETEEIIETRDIKFPLREREYIMKVKMNKVGVEEVMEDIDKRFNKVMKILEESDLPEEVDLSLMYKSLTDYYFSK